MSRLRNRLTGRIRLAMLTIAALAVISGALTPSDAQTRCGTEFIYYSDGTYSDVVGVRVWLPESCGCGFYSWGSTSSYREVNDSYC